jgi:PLP dependent protein
MRAVRSPGACQLRASAKQQKMPPSAGDNAHPLKKLTSYLRFKPIMPEDHTAAARQRSDARQEPLSHAFVGHQPDLGQREVALAHSPAYSAGMIDDAKTRALAVQASIEDACQRARRNPESVSLIAISKTHDAEAIRPLIAAGQRVFGENRVQEAQEKWPALKSETMGIELHLVGQLQSNKAEDALALFDYIHSVDRSSLVTALARAQEKLGRQPRCFVQVNIGQEDQKGGCSIANVPELLAEARYAGLDVVGLMAVPPADVEPAPYFALLAKMAGEHGLPELSMGMSGDFETAIMLGATHIRVGTALFGGRA